MKVGLGGGSGGGPELDREYGAGRPAEKGVGSGRESGQLRQRKKAERKSEDLEAELNKTIFEDKAPRKAALGSEQGKNASETPRLYTPREANKPSLKERVWRGTSEKALPIAGGLAGGVALAAYLIGTGGMGAILPLLLGAIAGGVGGTASSKGMKLINNWLFQKKIEQKPGVATGAALQKPARFAKISKNEETFRNAIRERIKEKGLFRTGGRKEDIEPMLERLAQEQTSQQDLADSLNLTSAYKAMFKELQTNGTPLFSEGNFEALSKVAEPPQKKTPDGSTNPPLLQAFSAQLEGMNETNRTRLLELLKLSGEIARESDSNLMTPYNIGMTFSPNVFPVTTDVMTLAARSKTETQIMTQLITLAQEGSLDALFSKYIPQRPSVALEREAERGSEDNGLERDYELKHEAKPEQTHEAVKSVAEQQKPNFRNVINEYGTRLMEMQRSGTPLFSEENFQALVKSGTIPAMAAKLRSQLKKMDETHRARVVELLKLSKEMMTSESNQSGGFGLIDAEAIANQLAPYMFPAEVSGSNRSHSEKVIIRTIIMANKQGLFDDLLG